MRTEGPRVPSARLEPRTGLDSFRVVCLCPECLQRQFDVHPDGTLVTICRSRGCKTKIVYPCLLADVREEERESYPLTLKKSVGKRA